MEYSYPIPDFEILKTNVENYLTWQMDLKIHLQSRGFNINASNAEIVDIPDKELAKAHIYIRRHLEPDLKSEFLLSSGPFELLIALRCKYQWVNIRLEDFTTNSEYLSEARTLLEIMVKDLFRPNSELQPNKLLLEDGKFNQQHYNFKLRTDPLSAETTDRTQQVPLSAQSHFPVENTSLKNVSFIQSNRMKKKMAIVQLRMEEQALSMKIAAENIRIIDPIINEKDGENCCSRCGLPDHWSRICRTPRHLQQLYQQSINMSEMTMTENSVDTKLFTTEDFIE